VLKNRHFSKVYFCALFMGIGGDLLSWLAIPSRRKVRAGWTDGPVVLTWVLLLVLACLS
jgi:hypothetical protein